MDQLEEQIKIHETNIENLLNKIENEKNFDKKHFIKETIKKEQDDIISLYKLKTIENHMEIKEILPKHFFLIDLEDFRYIRNFFNYIEEMKKRNLLKFQQGYHIKVLTQNKCEQHGLPFFCYYGEFHHELDYLICPKCIDVPTSGYDKYFHDDYKYGLPKKIEQIFYNINIAEETIKQKFYPLYKKYSAKLEGNRKRRFEKNYNSMLKKIDFIKNTINGFVKGYQYNKLGLIYFLYYFPPIVINEFALNKNNIDENNYISKLSSYFATSKWITITRKIINKKEDEEFINNNFIISNNKLEINDQQTYSNIYYGIDTYLKKLSSDSIKFIDNKNDIIYCLFHENNEFELVILSKYLYKYKVIKRIEVMKINEDENDNENEDNYYILGKRVKINHKFYFDKNMCSKQLVIRIYKDFIYIFTNIFFCVLDKDYTIVKLILLQLWKNRISFVNSVIRRNKLLFIFMNEPKTTFIFNLNSNEIISKIEGLSAEYVFEIKKKNIALIKDNDKIMEINYKLGKLISIKYFHEIYVDKNNFDNYNAEKFSIVYKNKVIGKLNAIELKYILDNFKGFKYDHIINKNNFFVNTKK